MLSRPGPEGPAGFAKALLVEFISPAVAGPMRNGLPSYCTEERFLRALWAISWDSNSKKP